MNCARSSSSASAPAARTISVRQTTSGSRVTSAAARSQDSSAARDHSSSAVRTAISGRPGDDRQPDRAAHPQQDGQRREVEDVVGEDMAGLVGQDGAALLDAQQPDQLGVDHHDRPPRADRAGVGDGELRDVQLRDVVEVERAEDLVVEVPGLGQLGRAEAHRRAEVGGPQRALVAQLDQLAHHLVEPRDRRERRGGRAVGRVLEGARGDVLELVAVDGKRHAAIVSRV